LTQRPSPSVSLAEAMIVASTRLPVLTVIDLAFRSAVTVSNNVRSKPCVIRARRKRTNAVRSGVASLLEKPQQRRNDARSPRASASVTSERSYQTASSNALKIASGGQAGSPLVRAGARSEARRSARKAYQALTTNAASDRCQAALD